MKLTRIKNIIYYKIINSFPKSYLKLPDSFIDKKNIFIYFDYEREFSGHSTKINDDFIYDILTFLEIYKLKTTWFTVGKVIEKYPKTIERILNSGHEIGSHTYNHLAPLRLKKYELLNEFEILEELQLSCNLPKITGFHSPKNQWSLNTLKLLNHYKYCYDVVYTKHNTRPYQFEFLNYKSKLRIPSLCDDWFVYNNYSITTKEIIENYLFKIKFLTKGSVVGIGFHPWLMYNYPNLFDGFKELVNIIFNNADYQLVYTKEFIEVLNFKEMIK